jgi:hypothetical protein
MHRMANEEEREVLWNLVLDCETSIKEAEREAGTLGASSRNGGSALLGYRGVQAILSVEQPDGRDRIYLIEARYRRDVPEVVVKKWWSENEEFWDRKVAQFDPQRNLIVNGKWYSLGQEARDNEGNLLPGGGFGGRFIQFQRISWIGGAPGDPGAYRVYSDAMATRNLWFGGQIPPSYRDRLPDNARFLGGFDGPVKMS